MRTPARLAEVVAVAAMAAMLAAATGCAGRTPPGAAPGSPPRPGSLQRGNASWYGPTFHGKTTANGERYNMLDLTAAHRTLPFDTCVRVTNLANSRALVVRINDRGPFVRGRIIDLSYTAAKILDLPENGTGPVTLEVLEVDEGRRLLDRQREMVRRKGVKRWTERDFAELAAAQRGG